MAKPEPIEEAEIVSRLKESGPNDREVLGQIYENYSRYLLALLRVRLNREDAEEALMDFLIEIPRYLESYDPERGSLRRFLGVLMRRHAMSFANRKMRHMEMLYPTAEALDVAEVRALVDHGEPVEERDLLKHLTEQLSEEDRVLLLARYLEEKSVSEIAHSFDWPVGKVKSRLMRVRQKLRQAIKEGHISLTQ